MSVDVCEVASVVQHSERLRDEGLKTTTDFSSEWAKKKKNHFSRSEEV